MWAYCRRSLVLLVCVLAVAPAARVTAGVRDSPAVTVTGVALWPGSNSYFNLRAQPRLDARIVGTVQWDAHVTLLAAVQGDAVAGNSVWYRVSSDSGVGYMHSSGLGYVEAPGPWTGVLSGTDGAIASHTEPLPDAPSEAAFAPGTQITITGLVHGIAVVPGNDVWYRVSTGSYRPAYIYAANLLYSRMGAGPVPVPLLGAAAILAVDMDSGRELYSRDPDVERAPASLTKMMTAAVALDRVAPSTPMTVPDGAPSVGVAIGGTAMGLIPGERLSLHDLLYGLLLPSGNDAAYTIAANIAGTQDNFARLMNRKAAELGLTRTHFVQAYGLDAPGAYSTARDLLRLAIYDLRHYALFREIVKTQDHVIGRGPTHQAYVLHNRNSLLGVYPGAFGVKTGTTPQAGQNLVAAVQRDGHRIVVAILGATDRYADATAVLDYAVAVDVRASPVRTRQAA